MPVRRSNLSRLNSFTAWVLVIAILGAPIAVGSNRPQFWLLNFAVVALVAAVYFGVSSFTKSDRRFNFGDLGLFAYLAPAYVAALGIQHAIFYGLELNARAVNSGLGILKYITYGLLLWLLLQCLGNRSRSLAVGTFSVVSLSLYGFYAFLVLRNPEWQFFEKIAYTGYATGPFVNRNSFATFMAMSASFALALALRPRMKMSRRARTQINPINIERLAEAFIKFAPVAVFISAALATGSRMGMLVSFLGMAIVIGLWLRDTPSVRNKFSVWWFGGIFVFVMAIFFINFGGETFERLGTTALSADVRGRLYQQVWGMVMSAPLQGFGVEGFELAYRSHQAIPVSADVRWSDAHNTYLELWVEQGLVLGSIPPILCLLLFARLWSRARHLGAHQSHFARAAIASLVIGGVHSAVDFSLEIQANVFLIILIVALGLVACQIEGDEN